MALDWSKEDEEEAIALDSLPNSTLWFMTKPTCHGQSSAVLISHLPCTLSEVGLRRSKCVCSMCPMNSSLGVL